ncbi:unnamed protein product [Dibothriocephalus latus]|uniref:LEM domain-containing protein n=1 Tax=Dibothriocephalus latus TaxID=60516 RepID=A0A3P6TX40_DIBLA|nr:unnamed protein product [Dibothriocephalus latus]
MSSLSDDELRSALRDHGVHVGPITDTTRKVYERKLAKFTTQNVDKEEKKNRRQPRSTTSQLGSFKAEEPQTSLYAKNWPSQTPVNFGRSPSDQPDRLSTDVIRREARSRSSVFYSDEPYFNTQTASPQQNPGQTPIRPVLRFDPLDSASVRQAQEQRLTHTPRRSTGLDDLDGSLDNHIVTRQSITPVARSTGRFSFLRLSETAPLKDAGTSTSASLLFSPPASQTADQSQSYWPSFYLRRRSGSGVLSEDADSQWEYSRRQQTTAAGRLGNGDANSLSSTVSRLVSSLGRHVPNLILLAGLTLFIVLLSCYFLLKDKHGNVGRIAGTA